MTVTPFFDTQASSELWMTRRRTLWLALTVIAFITIAAVIGPLWSTHEKERELEISLDKRLSLLATSHTEVIDTWLDGLIRQGDRIVNSDLFRLYATEVDLIEEDISYLISSPPEEVDSEQAQLAAQLPELQNIFVEFSRYAGFLSGRLVHRNGQAYITTDGSSSYITKQQQQLTSQVLNSASPQFSPLQSTPAGLVLDMALPLIALDVGDQQSDVVAVLILSKVVTDKVNQLLSASPLIETGERIHLIQKTSVGYAEIAPWRPGQIEPIEQKTPLDDNRELPFDERQALRTSQHVYSVAAPLDRVPWWIVEEVDYDSARQSLNHYMRTAWSISLLLIAVFAVAFGAIWFQQIGLKNRQIASHFKR